MRQRRAAGDLSVTADEIRRGTAAILGMADAETARARPLPKGKKDQAAVLESKRKQGPEAMAEASGTEFYYRDEREESLVTPVSVTKPTLRGIDGERHVALLRRVALLMASIPGYKIKPGESLYACKQFPRFAQLLDMNTRHAALTDPKSHGLGKYAEMPIGDRQRRYYSELERICTLSNPVVGRGWWVSK